MCPEILFADDTAIFLRQKDIGFVMQDWKNYERNNDMDWN